MDVRALMLVVSLLIWVMAKTMTPGMHQPRTTFALSLHVGKSSKLVHWSPHVMELITVLRWSVDASLSFFSSNFSSSQFASWMRTLLTVVWLSWGNV